ncbi:hypothetical protein KPH14_010341 [Odynerus spinipes]|uniref:Uncharacterized protein n=1 Tax=Odynerus spinipes TaxID=1348599 RepID=A0AAD9RU96_9HYME|nr:hypothetical protein KPH14_010341 [Odynerus spinipes]
MANALAHLKEKEICILEDMEYERESLTKHREETTKVRSRLNSLLLLLRDIREEYSHRRVDAGMLVTQPVLREMEKAIKMRDTLMKEIEATEREIQEYTIAIERKKRNTSKLSSRTKYSIVSSLKSFEA